MFFYVLVLPTLIASLWIIHRLYKLAKHDTALFRFCDLRREVMGVIRDRGFELPREDYVALRKLMDQTGKVIHDYNNFKEMVFSIKVGVVVKAQVAHIDSAKRFESYVAKKGTVSENVRRLQVAYLQAVAQAALTFIPAPKLAMLVLTIIIKLISYFATKSIAQQAVRLKRWVDLLDWAETKSELQTI